MRLESVSYAEFEGQDQEWRLNDLTLGAINLLVGRNSAGKSRTLNIIGYLAKLLAGLQLPSSSGHYDVHFDDNGTRFNYRLRYEENEVLFERLFVNGQVRLDRGTGGEGTIFAEEIQGGSTVRFQTPPAELAVVARRDSIQHKYLEPLYEWGAQVRHYYFGTFLGKDRFAIFVPKGGAQVDERDPNAVVALFRKALKDLGDPFKQSVIADMIRLDYPIEDIRLGLPISFRIVGDTPADPQCLIVKERDLPGDTDQHSMSQGMFRALSIIIHTNYAQQTKRAACILIDDIGEGLDFDRSCRLIEMLREKAQHSSVQLIMSTNDRFVMNRVPLEEWSLIERKGPKVIVRNIKNSKEAFEEFKFTGLSNFDFFASDFIHEKPLEEAIAP